MVQIFSHSYSINHTFPATILLLKVERFEGILNEIKIKGMLSN